MKKLFLFILLFCTFSLSEAQKEYIWIYTDCTNSNFPRADVNVCGAITETLENKIKSLIKTDSINGYNKNCEISKSGRGGLKINDFDNIGRLLNLIAEDGYEIEQTQAVTSSWHVIYIMSRQKSTQTSESTKRKKGDVNEDNEVDINDVVAVINIMADDTNAT